MSDIIYGHMALALYWKFPQAKYLMENVYHFNLESDFLSVSKTGYITEIEIKLSRSDFRSDFKKTLSLSWRDRRLKSEALLKHDEIAAGRYGGLKHFYFCCPEGMVSVDEIPDHAGLIEIRPDHRRPRALIEKKAPQLPNAEKISEERELELVKKYMYKYLAHKQKQHQKAILRVHEKQNDKPKTGGSK